MINSRGAIKVSQLLTDAKEKGATLHMGGSAIDETHFEPTLLTDVPSDSKCFSSEVFGPLCAIRGFNSEEEVLASANASEFGLAGYFFSTGLFFFNFLNDSNLQVETDKLRSPTMLPCCRKTRSWYGWYQYRCNLVL